MPVSAETCLADIVLCACMMCMASQKSLGVILATVRSRWAAQLPYSILRARAPPLRSPWHRIFEEIPLSYGILGWAQLALI